jgi:hypothetical protein
MSIYVGGVRLRLIKDNFVSMIEGSLDQLGWFDAGRMHMPVSVIGTQMDDGEKIEPNIVSVSTEIVTNLEMELGSGLEENKHTYFVDIYAENEDVGLHLAGDIYDIVRGKMPSIGRGAPDFDVLDLTQATPTVLFVCEIENVDVGRSRDWGKTFNRYWWTIGLDINDYYDNEGDV